MRSIDLIIEDITEVRAKNNKLWMGLLRIAFELAPEEAGNLLQEIHDNDMKVSKFVLELKEIVVHDNARS